MSWVVNSPGVICELVNESSDSVAFHRRSQSKVVSGVSGRKYRYQLFKATVWHHTKRIHNSGQNNF